MTPGRHVRVVPSGTPSKRTPVEARGFGCNARSLRLPALVLFVAAAIAFAPRSALAQVTFIDVDTLPSLADVSAPRKQPVRVSVAVLRFLPKNAKVAPQFPTNGLLTQAVAALGQQGQVNLLYLGDRYLAGTEAVAARFDSAERRPAFSLDAAVNHTLTNREFGLHLKVAVMPAGGERVELNWSGSFSWAPGLIDQWAGEKYLLFGMRVAAFLKPGAVYQEGDDDEDAAPRGVNIGGLFKRKTKATNVVTVASEVSFLVAERREVPLAGKQIARPEQLVVSLFPIGDDPKQPGFICLFQQFSWDD